MRLPVFGINVTVELFYFAPGVALSFALINIAVIGVDPVQKQCLAVT